MTFSNIFSFIFRLNFFRKKKLGITWILTYKLQIKHFCLALHPHTRTKFSLLASLDNNNNFRQNIFKNIIYCQQQVRDSRNTNSCPINCSPCSQIFSRKQQSITTSSPSSKINQNPCSILKHFAFREIYKTIEYHQQDDWLIDGAHHPSANATHFIISFVVAPEALWLPLTLIFSSISYHFNFFNKMCQSFPHIVLFFSFFFKQIVIEQSNGNRSI